MTAADEEFLRSLRATFKVEAGEHLQEIGKGLLHLEKAAAPEVQQQLIETVFRAAHSLKGAARAVDFTEIESLCQSIEDLFAAWKRRESLPTPSSLDTAHRAIDKMAQAISASAGAPQSARPPQEAPPAAPQPVAPITGETDTVRISTSSLDARLLEAEEMLAAKLAVEQRAADLGAMAGRLELWRKEWARVQPQTRALRQPLDRQRNAAAAPDLHGLVEFLDWNHDYVRTLEGKVTALRRTADQDRLLIGKLVDDLLENSKKLLMLPLATLAPLLSKLVRDQCRDQSKAAELTIRGEQVTIDKRILEQLKDPLIHLLRNCIDHGIETPDQRRRVGKPARAEITLKVSPVNSTQVEISVGDDGAGIDIEKVKAAALKRGIVAANAADQLSEAAALALVFQSWPVDQPHDYTICLGRGLGPGDRPREGRRPRRHGFGRLDRRPPGTRLPPGRCRSAPRPIAASWSASRGSALHPAGLCCRARPSLSAARGGKAKCQRDFELDGGRRSRWSGSPRSRICRRRTEHAEGPPSRRSSCWAPWARRVASVRGRR